MFQGIFLLLLPVLHLRGFSIWIILFLCVGNIISVVCGRGFLLSLMLFYKGVKTLNFSLWNFLFITVGKTTFIG